jgi:polyisoprenoid-binding protein YceI
MTRLSRFAVGLAAVLPSLALASTWNIDPAHSNSSFVVKHMVITNVRGEFGKTTGVVTVDDKDVTKSSVEVTIDATTVNTRVAARDDDLRSPNFFEVAKYPTITFKSTKVEQSGQGKLKVTGDLTIKGVTKSVVLDVTGPTDPIAGPRGEQRRGVSASTRLNRKEFGLTWSKAVEAGPIVGDMVDVQLDVEVVKADGAK